MAAASHISCCAAIFGVYVRDFWEYTRVVACHRVDQLFLLQVRQATLITEQNLTAHFLSLSLCPPEATDSNMAGEDGFDEKGCHCEISVEDLLPSVKSVIRAVR